MTLKKRAGLILRLANGATVTSAARAEKVSRSHVYKLLEDPTAQRDMLKIRARHQRLIVGKLVKAASRATDVLEELLKDESAQIRLSASRTLLMTSSEWIGRVDHEIRIADLEADRARKDAQNGRH